MDTETITEQVILAGSPTPTPTPSAPVVCYPISGDIAQGFYCSLNLPPATTIATFPDYAYQEYQIGTSTEGFYFRNSLDIGDLLIITFLATIIILFFSLKLWEFIFGKKVSIKRKEI
jgi:hypothetical protein